MPEPSRRSPRRDPASFLEQVRSADPRRVASAESVAAVATVSAGGYEGAPAGPERLGDTLHLLERRLRLTRRADWHGLSGDALPDRLGCGRTLLGRQDRGHLVGNVDDTICHLLGAILHRLRGQQLVERELVRRK